MQPAGAYGQRQQPCCVSAFSRAKALTVLPANSHAAWAVKKAALLCSGAAEKGVWRETRQRAWAGLDDCAPLPEVLSVAPNSRARTSVKYAGNSPLSVISRRTSKARRIRLLATALRLEMFFRLALFGGGHWAHAAAQAKRRSAMPCRLCRSVSTARHIRHPPPCAGCPGPPGPHPAL